VRSFLEPSIPEKLQSDLATRTCAFLGMSSVPTSKKEEKSAKGKDKEAAEAKAKQRAEEHEKGVQAVLQALYDSLAATLFMDTSIPALTRIFDVHALPLPFPFLVISLPYLRGWVGWCRCCGCTRARRTVRCGSGR
jgi:hypothetical protein